MTTPADALFNISFRVAIGLPAILATSLVSGSFKETLIFFSAGVVAVGQIAAAFYTARVLLATLRKDERDAAREAAADARAKEAADLDARREALLAKREALRFGERWNHPSMFHARDALRLVSVYHAASDDELRKFIESKETNVIHIVNFIEEIGTACRIGVVDEETLQEQFDYVVVSTWKKLFPWIAKQRDDHDAIWEDFERLYDKWKVNFK